MAGIGMLVVSAVVFVLALYLGRNGTITQEFGILLMKAAGIGALIGLVVTLFQAAANTAKGAKVSVCCAKCDQYLGTANRFDSPCPRCGSNRYRQS